MAITPFTQPVKQGKFIPRKPSLPTEAIASATKDVYKQNVKQRDRLNKVFDKIASQQAASVDRPALKQLEEKYRGQMEAMSEDELLFNDKQKITEMARDASEQLGYFEQNRKQIQNQIDQIDKLENLSEAEKQARKQAVLQDAGLSVQDGKVDPDSVFSPTSIGEEPESLTKKARKMAQELPERFLGEGVEVDKATGKIKVTEASGVSGQRIANYLAGKRSEDGTLYGGALTEDPQVQNYMRQKKMSLMRNKGYSEEQAREAVNNEIKNATNSIIENFSYQDVNTSRVTRSDAGGGGKEGEITPAISVPMEMQSQDEATGADKKELESHQKYAREKAIEEMFKGTGLSEREIEDIRNTIENPPKLDRSTRGQRARKPNVRPRERALAEISRKYGQDVADRVKNEYDDTKERVVNDGSIARRRLITPSKDVRLNELRRAFKGAPENLIKSSDIEKFADAPISDLLPGGSSSESYKKKYKNEVINYGDFAGLSNDGQVLRFRMPNSDEVSEPLRGEKVDVQINDKSKNSIMQAYANVVEKTGDPWTAEALRKNMQYDDIPVETKEEGEWAEIDQGGLKGKARYNPNIAGYQVATEGDDGVTFRDVIKTEGKVDSKLVSGLLTKAQKFSNQGIDTSEINTYNEMQNALKTYVEGGEYESADQRQAIEQVMRQPIPFEHKGMALDYLNKMNSK